MKYVKVTCLDKKEEMFLNISAFLAIRSNKITNGSSVLMNNGVWIEVEEPLPVFQALIEDRDPTVAKVLFGKNIRIRED